MAHKNISNKLDAISYDQLGIQFDEGLVWEKLENRLEGKKKVFSLHWGVAASFFLAIFLVPLTILKTDDGPQLSTVHEQSDYRVTGNEPNESSASTSKPGLPERSVTTLKSSPQIRSKSVTLELAFIGTPELDYKELNGISKPQFATEDISVIVASLQHTSVNERRLEKGKKLSVSAQWQSPSQTSKADDHDKTLKIEIPKLKLRDRN